MRYVTPEESAAIEEQAQERFSCGHEATAVTWKVSADGSRRWWRQCQRCGAKVERLRASQVNTAMEVAEFDDDLATEWWHAKSEYRLTLRRRLEDKIAAETSEANAEWWESYNAYLRTPEWRIRRTAVFERAGFMCEGCRIRPAEQVHHLTYIRVGREMLFDLVAICEACHQIVTRSEREARVP